jgi:hypothetical protein
MLHEVSPMSFKKETTTPRAPAPGFTPDEMNAIMPAPSDAAKQCPSCGHALEVIVIKPFAPHGSTVKVHCWNCGRGGEKSFA